jgi:hypothetical protein
MSKLTDDEPDRVIVNTSQVLAPLNVQAVASGSAAFLRVGYTTPLLAMSACGTERQWWPFVSIPLLKVDRQCIAGDSSSQLDPQLTSMTPPINGWIASGYTVRSKKTEGPL